MAIGYKVFSVKNSNENLRSACFNKLFAYNYYKTKPNYPKKGHGPFAVFKTLKEARNFLSILFRRIDGYTRKIFKVRYVKSKAKNLWIYRSKKEDYKELCKVNGILVKYADLASKVTILEEVE